MRVQYEFNEEENKTILKVAKTVLGSGIVFIFYGIINFLNYLSAFLVLGFGDVDWSETAYEIAVTLMFIIIGAIMLNVAKYFRLIHGTDGRDIDHLLEAFGSLAKLNNIQIVLFTLIILYILIDKVPFVIKMLSNPVTLEGTGM